MWIFYICLCGYYCSILEDVCMECLVGIIIVRDGSKSVDNCYLSLYLIIINLLIFFWCVLFFKLCYV